MTRGELLARADAHEIAEWRAYSVLNAKEQERAAKEAQLETAVLNDLRRK